MSTAVASARETLAEMRRIRTMYALKHTMRYRSKRDLSTHTESVAEHLFGMMVLAKYFAKLEGLDGSLDMQRVHDLILYHELGEIETGDILFHEKEEEHRKLEREAAARVAMQLPESMQEEALEYFREFEERETPEAQFAYAIDKIEPIFQILDNQPALDQLKVHKITRDVSIGIKLEASEQYPHMQRFIHAWYDHIAPQGYFA